MKKVSLSGGVAQVIADAESGRGGAWAADGSIVFSPSATGALYRVSANGGAATPVTTVNANQRSHRWPHLLPDGRSVLFTIQLAGKNYDDGVIALASVSGGEPQVVIEGGSFPQFAESGHMVFGRGGKLLSAPLDLRTGRAGTPITVIDNVQTSVLNGAALYALSSNGTLLYQPGVSSAAAMALLSATRSGQTDVLFDRRLIGGFFGSHPTARVWP